jgi:hypothetical protein
MNPRGGANIKCSSAIAVSQEISTVLLDPGAHIRGRVKAAHSSLATILQYNIGIPNSKVHRERPAFPNGKQTMRKPVTMPRVQFVPRPRCVPASRWRHRRSARTNVVSAQPATPPIAARASAKERQFAMTLILTSVPWEFV